MLTGALGIGNKNKISENFRIRRKARSIKVTLFVTRNLNMDTKQLLTYVKPIPSASKDDSDTANKCPAIKVKEEPNDEYNIPPVSASVFNNQSQNQNISVKKEIKTESIKQESIPPAVEPIFSSITQSGINPESLPTKCGPCNVVLETSEAYLNHFISEKHSSIVLQSQYPNIPLKTEIKTESIKQESIPSSVEPIFSSITQAGMNPTSLPTSCGPCNVVLETQEAYRNHFLSKKHLSIVRRGIKVQKINDNSISATKRPAQENENLSDPTSTASKKSRPYPQIQEDTSTNPINRDPRLKPKDTSKKLTLAEYKEKHKANDQPLFKKTKNLAEQDFQCPKGLPLPIDLQLQWQKQFDVVISPEIFSQCLQNKCLICNVSTTEVNNPKALSWHYLGQPHLMAVSRIIGVSPKTVVKDGKDAAKSLISESSKNTHRQWKSFEIGQIPPEETTVKLPKNFVPSVPPAKISTKANHNLRLSHECRHFETRQTPCKFCRQYKFISERNKNQNILQGQRVTIYYVAKIPPRELEFLKNRKNAKWTTFRTFGMRVFCFHPDVEDFALSSNIIGGSGPPKAFYGENIKCEFTMR